MGRINIDVDLLKLKRATVMDVKFNESNDPDKAHVEKCVVVPVTWGNIKREYNGVRVRAKRNEQTGQWVLTGAYIGMVGWEASEKFRETARKNHADNADYVPPTHNVYVNWSKELTEIVSGYFKNLFKDPNERAKMYAEVTNDREKQDLKSLTDDELINRKIHRMQAMGTATVHGNSLDNVNVETAQAVQSDMSQFGAEPAPAAPNGMNEAPDFSQEDDLPF